MTEISAHQSTISSRGSISSTLRTVMWTYRLLFQGVLSVYQYDSELLKRYGDICSFSALDMTYQEEDKLHLHVAAYVDSPIPSSSALRCWHSNSLKTVTRLTAAAEIFRSAVILLQNNSLEHGYSACTCIFGLAVVACKRRQETLVVTTTATPLLASTIGATDLCTKVENCKIWE